MSLDSKRQWSVASKIFMEAKPQSQDYGAGL